MQAERESLKGQLSHRQQIQVTLKVVHYQRKPSRGAFGVERYFDDVRGVTGQDFDIVVHTCRSESRGVWRRCLEIFRARTNQGDVNHVTGDVHFLVLLLQKRRTLLTILDCVSLERATGLRRWLIWFFWYWLPERRCSLITVISESSKQQLLKNLRCDPEKVVVVPCSVSPEFKKHHRDFNELCPTILQIGTTPNKNIERVAAALAGFGCRLLIVGRLSRSQLTALHENTISFENLLDLSRPELLSVYARSDVVMFASMSEGFGLPIVEANAIGRVVITSSLSSMPEVAANAACYVDPFDVLSIRSAVQRVCSDAAFRAELIDNGFKNAQRFQVGLVAEQFSSLYRRLYASSNDVDGMTVAP